MTTTDLLQVVGRNIAGGVGRQSRLIQATRPMYEGLLNWTSGGKGIAWPINGVTYRIDPRHRHRLGHAYDPPVANFLRERVAPGSTCFDVGANVGVYVLQLAHWSGPDGRVVAFEPNEGARTVLERHISLNGIAHRVTVVPSAVGEEVGEATLYAADSDGMSRLGEPNCAIAAHATPRKVHVVTLDAYCCETSLAPDWLIVDVEGFEIAVLSGARQLIRERPNIGIVVEMHPNVWSSAGTDLERAKALLDELSLTPVPLTGQSDVLREHGLVHLQTR